MLRSVPTWFFLLCLILWLGLTVGFGWMVKSAASGGSVTGTSRAVVLRIASFPSLAANVFEELGARASGAADDRMVVTLRDPGTDYSGFAPVATVPGIRVEGLLARTGDVPAEPGWRLLVGAFATPDGMRNMALLMAPDLRIVTQWILDEIPVGGLEPQGPGRTLAHGIAMLPDGSLIVVFDGGMSIERFDSCGNRLWTTPGIYNHNVDLDSSGRSVWTILEGDRIVKLAVADGRVERDVSMQDIIDANPEIDILELLRVHENDLGTNSRNTSGRWLGNAFHLNDVDPLPAALAARFPQFAVDDLVISARTLNLLFVVDPATLRIKWWRMGATKRQHDPDWLPTGEILAFNNRMSRDYSEIVAIDPRTMKSRVVYDGRKNRFYSRIRGKVQLLASGTLVITSPQQGRAFEVKPDGSVALEIADTKPGSDSQNYTLSEMHWLPADFFQPGTACIPALK